MSRLLAAWVFLAISGLAYGHEVSQMFFKLSPMGGTGFEAVISYDAGYATTEMRADTEAPQPKRSWLFELSPTELDEIRAGAEAFLRESIEFRDGEGKAIPWLVAFPDFSSDPPDFPILPNDGAYFRMLLRPDEPVSGEIFFHANESEQRPTFVVMLMDGTERLIITESGSTSFLFTAPQVESEAERTKRISPFWFVLACLLGLGLGAVIGYYRKMTR